MQAVLIVNDLDSDKLASVEIDDIFRLLEQAGVTSGLCKDTITKTAQEKSWRRDIIVAEGTPPVPPTDAKLDFCFPTEASLKPKILKDGRVDYREVNVVHSVDENDILVRKIPAKPGINGTDVGGKEIPAGDGKDINVSPGAGTYRDPEDELILRAKTDGVVFYNPKTNEIMVHDVYVIPHSVDFSSGNLHVKSSVEIHEDVKPGFLIETPYNVDVKGVIEHASVICGGMLNVRSGITGNIDHPIKVGGDVHAKYIYNQSLISGGSVYVGNEIRGSDIECQDEVIVAKRDGIILGGHTKATNQVSAPFIGNENNIPTIVEVGINSQLRKTWQGKQQQKAEIEEKIDKIREEANEIIMHTKTGIKNIRFIRLRKQWNQYKMELEPLKKELATLERAYYNAAAPEVRVQGTVYQGTVIKIKRAAFTVKGKLSRVKFKLAGNVVQFEDLTT
ncbi:MAG: DUF342 domain-containing protein [bacterium]